MKKIISLLLIGAALGLFAPPSCGRKGPDAPLAIVSTYPDGTSNNDMPRNVSVSVSFSVPVDPDSIRFSLREGTNEVACTMNYSDRTAVFQPAALLAENTMYSATVSAGVRDLSGNALALDHVWYFKTGTATAPLPGQGYIITASAGANGRISPSGSVIVSQGASQSFTITPNSGFRVADVMVDGASAGAVTTYIFTNVTANHTIAASFGAASGTEFTITASAGSNGSISPSGTVGVIQGGSQTFSITPNSGYHVADVVVDGRSAGAVSSYTFSNVSAGHTIRASFAINTYQITATAGEGGSISCFPSTVNYGASSVCRIRDDRDYRIADVLVDGVSVGRVSSYTFRNVREAHTITATFEQH